MVKKISVLVPFYGSAQLKQFELVVESILSQTGVEKELIVAGISKVTRVFGFSDIAEHLNEDVPDVVRTGALINNGLRLAEGEFTYVSDADIVFPHSQYLKQLVDASREGETFLKRPPMRRLLLTDFSWFYSLAKSMGLGQAIGKLDFSQDYVAKPVGTERPMRIFQKYENGKRKVFIASGEDFKEYISNEKHKGAEPRFFNQDRHCGAVFAPTGALRAVGGYHEGFFSWGVWDADVQWKLDKTVGMELIPNLDIFNVVHLDHKRGYFSVSKWKHDRTLQEKRRSVGFQSCINRDVMHYLNCDI